MTNIECLTKAKKEIIGTNFRIEPRIIMCDIGGLGEAPIKILCVVFDRKNGTSGFISLNMVRKCL